MRQITPRWLLPSESQAGRLLIALMVLGFAALIVAGIVGVRVSQQNQEHVNQVKHTYQVELALAGTNIALERAEAARRGYIVSADPDYLARHRTAVAGIAPTIEWIGSLTADNAEQQARVTRMRAMMVAFRGQHDRTNAMVRSGQRETAAATFSAEGGSRAIRNLRALLAEMTVEEERLLEQRDADQRNSVRSFAIVRAIAGALIVLVALLSFVTVRRYTREVRASRDTLRNLADSLEESVEERTSELRRANDEIQRFAYIVSHDLRSPLVNVMGFTAELEAGAKAIAALVDRAEAEAPQIVDDEARDAARIDLPEAIGFIRTSTAKMDRLINAILKLAREGRRVIAPEPLAMDALVASIRETLQHRLDEKGAEIVIDAPLPTIVSDRIATDQVFSNVIENAVKYADPARPGRIVVRGRADLGRAIFEIADNGRGIDPRDHDRVFDLFRRSGQQDQPGEGIGLAHVRALTYRLGGTIDVTSELGSGATFRIVLPLRHSDHMGSAE